MSWPNPNPTRERQISRQLIESWIEAGLRQLRDIQDGEDVVDLQLGPLNKDLVNVIYKVKPMELEVETIIHRP
jgi:hypothetical protein